MALCNPLSSASVDLVIDALYLPPGARVLDLGCGKGEILIRVLERWPGASGVGVDWSPSFVATAKEQAAERLPDAAAEFREEDAVRSEAPPGTLDLCIAVGSTWLVGDLDTALGTFRTWLKPGGLALVGEGYWRRPPSSLYLDLLGAVEDDYTTHEGNTNTGISLGFEPLFACATTVAEWDRYEWTYFSNIERWARDEPEDPERDQILERARLGRERYIEGGRDMLGFGLYLFRA